MKRRPHLTRKVVDALRESKVFILHAMEDHHDCKDGDIYFHAWNYIDDLVRWHEREHGRSDSWGVNDE